MSNSRAHRARKLHDFQRSPFGTLIEVIITR
jgi:hypothetical protein